MPLPTPRDLHVNAALANISIAYRNANYIAGQVFPTVPVQKKSDFYWQFDKSAWFRNDVKVRAPGTRSARTDYSVSSASYLCTEYSLAHEIPDKQHCPFIQ